MSPDLTIGQALMQGIKLLTDEKIDPPRLTAELLLMHALRKERVFLFSHSADPLPELAWIHYGRYLHERIAGKPVQYITGHQEFFTRNFKVQPGVLIPRPETEHLIEYTLNLPKPIGVIADAGVGSGAICVTLAAELRQPVIGLDLSPTALEVARQNAAEHKANVHFIQSNWLSALRPNSLDLLVSNPPYIALTDKPTLQREVRDHEPDLALFAGDDGQDAYRILEQQARQVLKPGCRILLEIGALSTRDLFSNWNEIEVQNDLSGRPCLLTAVLPEGRAE
ncbi:MAG: peptide chain release factor N(5)-glutamine methyltransferase [Acidobacteria bacterium]|nr:peptide chain release factor N(5)-glutamine methyltransferase [Acidobacteriota bacterium]